MIMILQMISKSILLNHKNSQKRVKNNNKSKSVQKKRCLMQNLKKTLHFQRKLQHKILRKTRKKLLNKIVLFSEHDRHINLIDDFIDKFCKISK